MNEPPVLSYNLSEAAKALHVSRPTMSALAKSEGFPAFRIGSRYVIPVDALNAWLIQQAEEGRTFMGPNASKEN